MGKITDNTALVEAGTMFSMAFWDAYRSAKTERIGFDLLSGGKAYASNSRKNKYPIIGMLTGLREWIDERVFEDIGRYVYELENRTFEKSVSVPVNDFEDDQYQGYTGIAEEIGRQAYMWPDDLIVAKLQAGTPSAGAPALCFDGQHYFDTDHPVDPLTVGSSTYANRFTATALSSVNFASTLSSMQRIKGRDGRPLGFANPANRVLLVPPQLRETAKNVVEAPYLSSGATNTNMGEARVVVWDRLENEGTVWYLADTTKPTVFFQEREQPGDAGPFAWDPAKFERDQIRFGIKARGAAGFGVPWGLARAEA